MRLILVLILFVSVAGSLFPAFKPWYNYYNAFYGTKAISLGNAFTAVADDGTAAFWNPAGFGRLTEPTFYLSYRTDLQKTNENETRTQYGFNEYFKSNFRSRLNQIDFFSIAFPVHGRGWHGGSALSYYRYIPTGFKGYSETAYYTLIPWHYNRIHRLDFVGSEGVDVLAISAASTFSDLISFGVTLQIFFNSSRIQYTQSAIGPSFSHRESKLMGGRNLIFGLLVTPFRFLSIGGSYQTSLQSKIQAISQEVSDQEPGTGTPVENMLNVHLPTRFALGIKIAPWPSFFVSYDYSKVFWEKGTLEGFESFNKNLFFYFMEEEMYQKKNPENHRMGAEYSFTYRGLGISLRGGWYSDKQFYTDWRSAQVTVTGVSLGVAIHFSTDLAMEFGYQRPTARWKEKSYFGYEDLYSRYTGSFISLSMIYRFKKLFSGS